MAPSNRSWPRNLKHKADGELRGAKYKKKRRLNPPAVSSNSKIQTLLNLTQDLSLQAQGTRNSVRAKPLHSDVVTNHTMGGHMSRQTNTSAASVKDEWEDLPESPIFETNNVITEHPSSSQGSESSGMFEDALESQPNRTQTLSDLSDDAILSIMDHMSAGNAVLLSLTCRSFHTLVRTRKASVIQDLKYRTRVNQRLNFLGLLEQDCQGQLLCTFCEKLHKRQSPAKELSFKNPIRSNNKCSAQLGSVNLGPYNIIELFTANSPECFFSRSMLDLVLRQVLLGEGYGIAIEG